MSGSIEGMTPDRFHHTSQWFLREATLKAASKVAVDHHHLLPFSATWGDGTMSSSDGQRFAVQRDGLLGAVYPRYFGYYDRAITLYTHLSDQFGVCRSSAWWASCARGAEINPADLAHVWPLQHARIIPNGTYFLGWSQGEAVGIAAG